MTGSIVKRGEKTYLLRLSLGLDTVTGRRLYKTETCHGTRKEAEARLRDLVREYDQGTLTVGTKKSLNEFLQQWLETARQRLRERTWEDYRSLCKYYLQKKLGRLPLDRISPLEIQRAYNEMMGRGLSALTVRKVHCVLNSALKQAVKWRLLATNPACQVDLPRQKIRRIIRAMERAQALAFLRACRGHRLEALFHFALQSAARPEETLGLWWDDIDFETGRCNIQRVLVRPKGGAAIFQEPKTAGSRRSIPLDARMLRELKRHRALQAQERLMAGPDWNGENLVFCSQLGTPIWKGNLVRRVYKPLLKKAGLPSTFRLRDLRHTCATLLLQAGEHIKSVSERLGHSDIRLTLNVYAFALPDMQESAAKRAADLFDLSLDHLVITDSPEPAGTDQDGGKVRSLFS